MRVLRKDWSDGIGVAAFSTLFVSYGRYMPGGRYRIELNCPGISGGGIAIIRSHRKPLIRNLYLLWPLGIIWTVFSYVYIPVKLLAILIFSFHAQCLLAESFITDPFERISGWISAVLMLIGIYQIVQWIL